MTEVAKFKRNELAKTTLEVRCEDLLSSTAQQLIRRLNAELEARYPEEGANFFRLDVDEVSEGRGAFVVAYMAELPVGCGAVRMIEPGVAEIKRMYVEPSARGRGIGRQILDTLEAHSRKLGARRLVLETGPRQPEALTLYRRAGFTGIPLFGEAVDSPHPELSVCMAKDL
jgi:putative acetyltransferase